MNHTCFGRFRSVFILLAICTSQVAGAVPAQRHEHPLLITNKKRSSFKTYEISLEGVDRFFSEADLNYWNQDYSKARKIFADNAKGRFVRTVVRGLYQGLFNHGPFRTHHEDLRDGRDFWNFVKIKNRRSIRPARFTYVLRLDGTLLFSEMKTTEFIRRISKHAILANASRSVLYAGEFYVRDEDGRKILILNNDSGTYAPSNSYSELRRIQELIQYNLPGLEIETQTFQDAQELKGPK